MESPSSPLRAILRFSLVATRASSPSDFDHDMITPAADEPPINTDNPFIRRLIEQILFSRQFILTYYLVLLVVLFVFILGHWGSKIWDHWTRNRSLGLAHSQKEDRGSDSDDEGGGSSSNTTVAGTESPPRKVVDEVLAEERTPLLSTQNHKSEAINGGIVARVRSWTMYQLVPIPAITAPKNVLPTNSKTLFILVLLGLNIFYLFYHVPLSIPMLFVLADRAALLFVANLPILYLLSSKTQPLNTLIGSSYESLNILHRRLGEWMCLLALVHTVGMFGVWYTFLRPIGWSLLRYISSRIIILGICATVAYETLYLTSIGLFRQKWYELFLGLHIVLQVAGLVLVWFHHHNSRPYVGVALAIFLIDRLIFRMILSTRTVLARLSISRDNSTVLLTSTIRVQRSRFPYLQTSILGGWRPSHHVFVTVPALGREHVLQAHPFTIASPAPVDNSPSADLKLIIRAQDGFSKDLLQYAKSHETVNVRLDGPYGSQTAVDLLQTSQAAVIVAGGSGIAVAWPFIWSLLQSRHDPEDLPTRKPILLLWVTRDKKHTEWVSSEQMDEIKKAGVEVVNPPPTDEYGRPDVAEIVHDWIVKKDCDDLGGSKAGSARKSFGVVVSGPDEMNRAVRNACAAMVAEGTRVEVEVEKFGW